MFEEGLIEAVRQWTKSRFSQNDMKGRSRIQDAYRESDCVLRLARHPAVLSMLAELCGRRPIPFQTLNFPRGTEQNTHSDTIHFHSWPQRWMCGVWVALEDITESNGPLHYYPGSHRLPIVDANDASALDHGYGHYEAAIQELVTIAGLKKERFLPRKGDCLVWAANLLHGGEPILDPQSSRFSQVSHYYFEGCDFFAPLLSDVAVNQIYFRDEIFDISTGEMVYSRHRRQLEDRIRSRHSRKLGDRIRQFAKRVSRRISSL